jgi:nitrous oxidase accessory protein NosD
MSLFDAAPTFNSNGRQVLVPPGSSISSCIQAAEAGATIVIPAGEYTETLVVDKEITIQGPEMDQGQVEPLVILNPTPGHDCVTLSSPHVVLRNLKFVSGQAQASAIVDLLSGLAVFENCVLSSPSAAPSEDAAAPSLPPIVTHSEGFLYLFNTTVESGDVALAYVDNNVAIEFQVCVLTAPKDLGIEARGNSKIRLIGSTITGCADTALLVLDDASIEITGGSFTQNNGDAIELSTKSQNNSITDLGIGENPNGAAILCSGPGGLALSNSKISGCATALLALDGFSVECTTNEFSSQAGFPIVAASGGSQISLTGDKFTDQCLVGIAATAASTVTCAKVELFLLPNGCSVTGDSKLTFSDSLLRKIEKCAIEAHDSATLELTDTHLQDCGEIGILIQNGVSGFAKTSKIHACDYGVHLVSNGEAPNDNDEGPANFVFEGCEVAQCHHNAVNLKSACPVFTDCVFENNQLREDAEEGTDPASGVDVRGWGTNPMFIRCKFLSNDQGIIASDYAHPRFTECEFTNNDVGSFITGAHVHLAKCTFTNNAQAALWVDGESTGEATECQISETQTVGALVEGDKTFFKFSECTITGTEGPTALAVKDQGRLELDECELVENSGYNLDISAQGQATVKGGSIGGSGKGVSVKVFGQGTSAEFSKVVFSGEEISAVLIGQQAKCDLDECDISECGTCGICVQSGGTGCIQRNKIYQIKKVGIQIDGGTPSIQRNEITSCATYGVHICSGAEPQVIDNIFRDNGTLDVNRE